ncbi:hypothetical protein PUN28_015266 [Cardiocondyla obscurior]|uniref:Uncharacterized protein n=1 Tax=Cardiocondyla obscurior TaxID=286306 RepID=A0AAW2F0P3_9HYME
MVSVISIPLKISENSLKESVRTTTDSISVIRSDPLIKRWLKFLKKVSCLMAAFRKGHIKVLKWMDGQLVFETSLKHPADREDFEATGNETYVPGKGKKSYNNQYDGDTLNTSSKTSNTSPKQSGKREEGWKEVVRMGQSDDSGRFMNSPFLKKCPFPQMLSAE